MPAAPDPVIDEGAIATAFSNDLLHLIVLPTEQCNFRCTYCYEDFSIGTMKAPVIEGVKRLLARRLPNLRRLHIAWFGGEPLIALNVIEEIAGYAQGFADRTAGLGYSGEMTTNAYLLDLPTARRLATLGIRNYQVTLDGPEELHDRTRVRRNGKGSFQRIWAHLQQIKSSSLGVDICLRVHVTPANLPVMPDFLRRVRREFLADRRFTVLLKAVGHWGGPNDAQIEVLEGPERTLAIARLMAEALPDIGQDSLYRPGEICYAARPNSLIIRASGDIGKCTVALSDPANSIGRILEDGTLELRNEDLRPWLRGWNHSDIEALACPLIGLPRKERRPVLLQIGARPLPAEQGHAETGG